MATQTRSETSLVTPPRNVTTKHTGDKVFIEFTIWNKCTEDFEKITLNVHYIILVSMKHVKNEPICQVRVRGEGTYETVETYEQIQNKIYHASAIDGVPF